MISTSFHGKLYGKLLTDKAERLFTQGAFTEVLLEPGSPEVLLTIQYRRQFQVYNTFGLAPFYTHSPITVYHSGDIINSLRFDDRAFMSNTLLRKFSYGNIRFTRCDTT